MSTEENWGYLPQGAPENDPDRPNLVWARSPYDLNTVVQFFANPETIRRLQTDRLASKIGEYCGLVHGKFGPGWPGGSSGLLGAHALFRGLKRPRLSAQNDSEIYVYVISSEHTYIFPRRDQPPQRVPAPCRSVFVVYVDCGRQAVDRARDIVGNDVAATIEGVVQFWEWVMANEPDPETSLKPQDAYSKESRLPTDSKGRYTQEVWKL